MWNAALVTVLVVGVEREMGLKRSIAATGLPDRAVARAARYRA